MQQLDETIDALWRMYEDNVTQSRHHETERAAIVGVVFTIGAVLIGLVTYDGAISGPSDIAVAVFLMALGIFGAGFSYKNYERSCYHFQRARGFRQELDAVYFKGRLGEINQAADARHDASLGIFRKMKLHRWWIAINLFIVLIAAVIVVLAAS
ncbi:hypothetical protein [Altererythrobacter sp. ZODW24]|uniref:hypothetical protein n=1 Tax=Altererythrobacter sp. ZODW24 TaxID=2185142 RepID=UPI000DF84ED3|nr:hypothetical protein [Altererythrobacter sp. ZODW24]